LDWKDVFDRRRKKPNSFGATVKKCLFVGREVDDVG
jgi:hypothetical protein